MQVVHQQDHDTHAMVGGSDIQAFGITQDASFFEVLSNTLYSNKPMAVVREVLCNAWDSHKASGCTDKAVVVTINDDEMIIRDYGSGIPHDKIHGIYCVYGNSTKKNDGNQTGGFGLGSKSPFAYTTHFTVENHYNGMRHINAISRGSQKTNGVPDFRVMNKIPTTESGVEVAIPINNVSDKLLFIELVRTVAKYGEMNVLLNGKKVEGITLSKSPEGILISKDRYHNSAERIYVRYGNVIYPINTHEEYSTEYDRIISMMDGLQPYTYYSGRVGYSIIFDAPPNSISVTPSRESLSMTDTTIDTLKTMFSKVSAVDTDMRKRIVEKAVNRSIQYHWNLGEELKLLNNNHDAFKIFKIKERDMFYSTEEAYYYSLWTSRPGGWTDFQREEMLLRFKSFIQHKVRPHQFKAAIATVGKTQSLYHYGAGAVYKPICQALMKSLLAKLVDDPRVSIDNFYVIEKESSGRLNNSYTPIKKWKGYSYEMLSAILKNVVYVISSKMAFEDTVSSMPVVRETIGSNDTIRFVYISPRKKNAREDAISFFNDRRMKVVDNMEYNDERSRLHALKMAKLNPQFEEPKKPKITGIPVLSSLITPGRHSNIDPRGHLTEDVKRIDKPEFVFKPYNLSGPSYNHQFFSLGDDKHIARLIVKRYGATGGICVNQPQLDKYIKEGAEDGYSWLGKKLLEEFQTNSNLLTYFSFGIPEMAYSYLKKNPFEGSTHERIRDLYRLGRVTDTFIKEFGLPKPLTDDEAEIIDLWAAISPDCKYYRRNMTITKEMKVFIDAIQELIKQAGVDPLHTLVVQELQEKYILDLIKISDIFAALSNVKTTAQQKSEMEALLLLAIQG